MSFKCGYVALIGRPNAGKSTLLNRILGGKLAITSAKAQTTRHRIAGIHTDETMQAIVVDTPGIHEAWTELNKSMVARAEQVMDDVDVLCWLGDMTVLARHAEDDEPIFDAQAEQILSMLEGANKPIIFVANKIDVVPHPLLLPVIDAVQQRIDIAAAVPVSALTGDGVDVLMGAFRDNLPEGPQLYPEEEWAQVTERFLVAEIIREKIFHLTEQEIPYSTTVEIRKFDESQRESKKKKLVKIYADIIVERGSQKGIVIGKGAEMLKRIGTMARKDIQETLGCKVYLELYVKVEKDWTKSKKGLRKVGLGD